MTPGRSNPIKGTELDCRSRLPRTWSIKAKQASGRALQGFSVDPQRSCTEFYVKEARGIIMVCLQRHGALGNTMPILYLRAADRRISWQSCSGQCAERAREQWQPGKLTNGVELFAPMMASMDKHLRILNNHQRPMSMQGVTEIEKNMF